MAREQHLSNAPIEEAVIELRITPREDARIEELAAIEKAVGGRYPRRLENRQFVAQLAFGAKSQEVKHDRSDKMNSWVHGFRFESQKPSRIFQANRDTFSFSWLRPYETWDAFVSEAKGNWQTYYGAWRPTSVTRLGARFINRISLPAENLDFDEYFTAFPRIPPDLPQTLQSFLSRVMVPADEGRTAVVIALALEEALCTEKTVSVILDIDVGRESPHLQQGDDLWAVLDSFRPLKNKAFFGSLTDKALSLFK